MAIENKIKYDTPEVLMIDCEQDFVKKLSDNGYNIDIGTFGKIYDIFNDSTSNVCTFNNNIENIIDKDVVIIDMKQRKQMQAYRLNNIYDLEDGEYLISKENQNEFNPINMGSMKYAKDFSKLFEKDSIIIIFADIEKEIEYTIATKENGRIFKRNVTYSNYEFLSGSVIIDENELNSKKYKIVAEGVTKEIFKNYNGVINSKCTFYINKNVENNTINLLENDFGNLIGYIQSFEDNEIRNTTIVLPQCTDKYILIKNIFENFLPILYPDMFKDFVKDTWMDREEYLLPEIKNIIDEKETIEKEYKEKLEKMDKKIEDKKEENRFLYNIISANGTGDFLVENIIKCLNYIGYTNVENWDKEIEDGEYEEDLHIYKNDKEYMIAEVKGVNGPPIEDDCNVVLKYKIRNMDRLKVSSIHGIVFMNYRKNIEPNKREENGFSKKEIKDAKLTGYTLVGTYELFKAIRLLQENIITKEDIKNMIETPGLFEAIPKSFEYIGKIDNLLKNADVICVTLENEEINENDELLIVDGNNYYKTRISSLMVNDKKVSKAIKGNPVGIKVDQKIPEQKSAKIYLVRQHTNPTNN